jgi:hypothetical protein
MIDTESIYHFDIIANYLEVSRLEEAEEGEVRGER